MYSIYRIVNFRNGKVYVGQTCHISRRKREHFRSLECGNHINNHLQRAYNKHGRDAFFFEILEQNIASQDIDAREQYWINLFDSFHNGYNRDSGGQRSRLSIGKKCTWNGIEYDSIVAAARANGMTRKALVWRLKKGYAYDSETPATQSPIFKKDCEWNGIRYETISDAAKDLGIGITAMSKRIARGYKCDDDLRNPSSNLPIECVWNGVVYYSMNEAARDLGITQTGMKDRLNKGFTCDDDLFQTENAGRKCIWDGIEYPTVAALAKFKNISNRQMREYLNRGYQGDDDLPKRTYKIRKNNS